MGKTTITPGKNLASEKIKTFESRKETEKIAKPRKNEKR